MESRSLRMHGSDGAPKEKKKVGDEEQLGLAWENWKSTLSG